ncbi:hypothetical protein [Methanolapillus millepedarum]|uniref:hypothetical protein n=1 Tax=Methanolapillus millepedarum TaxID=3028296 RepID=UPI0030B8EF09
MFAIVVFEIKDLDVIQLKNTGFGFNREQSTRTDLINRSKSFDYLGCSSCYCA